MKIPSVLNKNGSMAVNTTPTATAKDVVPVTDMVNASDKKGFIFGIRHLQCFLIFCGLSVVYAQRVNLSVAIVAMTDKQSTNPDFEEYEWSEKTKSLLLSSFFWGYVVTQVPAGQLARKFGGKILFLGGVFVCSLLTVLLPLCARLGNWQLVCALRVVMGLCQGILYPSTHTILSKWAPIEERGTLSTYSYTGAQFGTVAMLATSGVMAASVMGWPSIFYIPGGVGLVWSVGFFIWGSSSPSECKLISAEEKKLIETSLGSSSENESSSASSKTPWLKFFTSVPFMVLTLTHCTNNWGYWTLLTEIPTYMKNILGMDIKSNALLSALPYAVMFLMSFIFSAIQAQLSKRKCIPLSVSRKLFNSIAHWIPMIALVCLGYVSADDPNMAVILLTITVGINGAIYLGFLVNHIDLSPNFAGVMMGFSNCVANIMGIIAPLIVGFIVTNEKNPDQWRIIFFIAAGFYFIGNLLFVLFGSVEVQPWNDAQPAQNSGKKRNSAIVESQH